MEVKCFQEVFLRGSKGGLSDLWVCRCGNYPKKSKILIFADIYGQITQLCAMADL